MTALKSRVSERGFFVPYTILCPGRHGQNREKEALRFSPDASGFFWAETDAAGGICPIETLDKLPRIGYNTRRCGITPAI